MKKTVRIIGKLLMQLVLSMVLGTVLLTLAYMLPTGSIERNVASSAEIIAQEGGYPVLISWWTSKLDNFTDSIMMMEAAYSGEESILIQAMNSNHYAMEGYYPNEVLVKHYVDYENYEEIVPYSRYWHGYQIFIKPLFMMMDYGKIRILNGGVQLMLVIIVTILFMQRKMALYSIPYLLSYGLLMPIALAKSLQFSSCFYIFTVGTIVLLLLKDKLEKNYLYLYVFFALSIATAYFDFLTYPITTFGIPATVYISMRENKNMKSTLIRLVQMLFVWGFGYIGMWAGKWIVGSVITGNDVILDALNSVAIRSGHERGSGEALSVFQSIGWNIGTFLKSPFIVTIILFLLYMLMRIKIEYKDYDKKRNLIIIIPYIAISILPIVWYGFTVNHSTLHCFFTNKACVVTAFSGMCALINVYQTVKND